MEWTRRILSLVVIILALVVLAYSLGMFVDYLVTEKYHAQGGEMEEIIYTVKERTKEIRSLKSYFFLCAFFSLVVLASSVVTYLKSKD